MVGATSSLQVMPFLEHRGRFDAFVQKYENKSDTRELVRELVAKYSEELKNLLSFFQD